MIGENFHFGSNISDGTEYKNFGGFKFRNANVLRRCVDQAMSNVSKAMAFDRGARYSVRIPSEQVDWEGAQILRNKLKQIAQDFLKQKNESR